MKDLEGKRAVVTGAASGIGKATAEALARAGAKLYLSDVQDDALGSVAAALGEAVLRADHVDVSKRAEMDAYAADVHAHAGGPVDVLVNNAGVGLAGSFLETSLDDFEWVLSINLWGVIHGCHFFVPKMVEAGRGHVVNVASVLGLAAGADIAGYSTSKFAVVGLSESMRAELGPRGVGVTTICPGVIDTAIVSRTRYKRDPDATRPKVEAFYKKRGYSPERVAAVIVDAIRADRGVVPVSPEAWFSWYLKRFAPSLAGPVGRLMTRAAMGK